MKLLVKQVIETYRATGSIKSTAKEMEMSETKVRKILVTLAVG